MRESLDESGNILPTAGTSEDRAFFLANVQGMAFCYFLGGALITNFRFIDRNHLSQASDEMKKLWDETLWVVSWCAPYDFKQRYDDGEQAFLVSVSFPCWTGCYYQYRTSRQTITVNDVVDAMYELMDVKPRSFRYQSEDGKAYFRFSWMFLESDLERLLGEFSGVPYSPNWELPMNQTFRIMDRKLLSLAQRAVNVYPFMECEFYGW